MFSSFSITFTTVSYTHLFSNKEFYITDLVDSSVLLKFPVSYTHLDVYKRQFIYLEHPDTYLYEFIDNKETEITDFYMVRYVDDLYILFNSDKRCV